MSQAAMLRISEPLDSLKINFEVFLLLPRSYEIFIIEIMNNILEF